MRDLVIPLREVLSGKKNMNLIGEILHEGWLLKKSITPEISNLQIDRYYENARNAGAIGGKLLGAGGGGFLLLYVEQKKQKNVINALKDLFCLGIKLDNAGTRITYYDKDRISKKSPNVVLSQK